MNIKQIVSDFQDEVLGCIDLPGLSKYEYDIVGDPLTVTDREGNVVDYNKCVVKLGRKKKFSSKYIYDTNFIHFDFDSSDIDTNNIGENIKDFLEDQKSYFINEILKFKELDYSSLGFGHPLTGKIVEFDDDGNIQLTFMISGYLA